jgi:hypothetical protein
VRFRLRGGLALLAVAAVGCAWIEAHDPAPRSTMTSNCTGLEEEPCGAAGCCDGWDGWHCNPWAPRCEWQPAVNHEPGRLAPDGVPDADR